MGNAACFGPVTSSPRFESVMPESLREGKPFPGQSGLIHPKLDQATMLHFGDIGGATVRAAKADIAGLFAEHINLSDDFPLRGDLRHGALPVAGDIEVPGDVAAHAIKAMVFELS